MEFVRGTQIDHRGNHVGTVYVNPAQVEAVRDFEYQEISVDKDTGEETVVIKTGTTIQTVGDSFQVEYTPPTWARKIEAALNPEPLEKG